MGNATSYPVLSRAIQFERQTLRQKEMKRILHHYIGEGDMIEVQAYIVDSAYKKMCSKMDQFDVTYSQTGEEAELCLLQDVNEHFDQFEIDENGNLWRRRRFVNKEQ